jgi:hypothetical protein
MGKRQNKAQKWTLWCFFEKTISKFEKTGMIVPFYIKTKGPVRNLDF